VVPAAQRVHAVQLAWAAGALAAGRRVWAAPPVLTVKEWLRRSCEQLAQEAPEQWPRLLGEAEGWLLWREAARAAGAAEVLDEGALAQALERAHELAADWGIALGGAGEGSEPALLERAARHFAARCRELGAATPGALVTRLTTDTAGAAWLAGFGALPPRLAALARPAPADTAPLGEARAAYPASPEAEQEAIAAWCRERLLRQPDARLLIVVPGSPGARERLAARITEELDPGALGAGPEAAPLAGIEGGRPLDQASLIEQALSALRLLSGRALELEPLAAWLMSPGWTTPALAERAALVQSLRERRVVGLELRELRGALGLLTASRTVSGRELDGRLQRAAAALPEGRAPLRRWSERFARALERLGWPGPCAAGGAAAQTRLRFAQLLEEFGSLDAVTGALERAAAVSLLGALAHHSAYRFADEDAPVRISPFLSDPVIGYDGIWVAGASADVLPQPLGPDPFLLLPAQRRAALPAASIAGRRAEAERLLFAWRASAPQVVLSVPDREGDLALEASALMSALAPYQGSAPRAWLTLALRRRGLTESVPDDSGPRFTALRPLPGGTRSVTLQNACPFRAFAELRLGARAPERAEPGVAADQRGLLLHAALQELWQRLGDSATLAGLGAQPLAALISECVDRAARPLALNRPPRRRRGRPRTEAQLELFEALPRALARECRRAEILILELLKLELTRGPFTVEATEEPLELELAGGRLIMRVDRIDATESGRVILDYKSGRATPSDWYGERPSHPQLLAYLAATSETVCALAALHVNAREIRFAGVAAQDGTLPRVRAVPAESGGWPRQRERWIAVIEQLISAFLAGDARVDPAPGACEFCHLPTLCRIGAHAAPEAPPHPGQEAADD